MDSLLASYASDDEDDQEEMVQPALEKAVLPPLPSVKVENPPRLSLFGRLPPPKNLESANKHQANSSEVKSEGMAGTGKPPLHSVGEIKRPGSAFGSLPPPQFESSIQAALGVSSIADDASVRVMIPFNSTMEQSPPAFSIGAVKAENSTSALPPRPSLFAKLPPPKIEPGTTDDNPKYGKPGARPSLFGALPPPKAELGGAHMKVEDSSSSGDSSLFLGLPLPQSTLESDKKYKGKKQPIVFRPPIDISVLNGGDDDDWEPSKKKAKPEPRSTSGRGGGLSALLPPPKNNLGAGASLGTGSAPGGRRAAMETTGTAPGQAVNLESKSEVVNARMSTTAGAAVETQNEASPFGGVTHYDNSTYAVDQSPTISPQVQYTNEPYGWAAPQGAYAPTQMPTDPVDNSVYYEEKTWQHPGNVSTYSNQTGQASYAAADPGIADDPVAQVLQAERRRGREDRMAAPTVVEVKQADLTGPKMREDQLRTNAYGPSYQPVSQSKDKPSKLHRRKHQIGSLLHDMKAREMDLLERRAKGSLTKAETQAKYGW